MNKENIPQDNQEKIDFKELISALLNNDSVFSPKYLNRFSDLEKTEFDLLMATWPKIEEKRRKGILEDLEELAESNTLFFFENIFEFSMTDQNALIRQIAIRALWESDEKSLIPKLLELLDNDPEPVVQSQAAAGLGHFIYLGELGKFKNELINPIIID